MKKYELLYAISATVPVRYERGIEYLKSNPQNIASFLDAFCSKTTILGYENYVEKDFSDDNLSFLNNFVCCDSLLEIIHDNKEKYLELGYDESNAGTINYYHEDLNGSYSIKKTLPLFSSLIFSKFDFSVVNFWIYFFWVEFSF